MLAIEVKNLRKSYKDTVAVDDLSLEVPPGVIYGLLGPNGAGKTTTIRCICTLLKPDRGTIKVCGLTEERAIRQKLGYVAQEVALDKVLTGRELLQLQAALYHLPPREIPQAIERVVDLLQLGEYADKRSGTYSGGIRKRLDLAAGLLHQPEVLVLDEPTVGLDIQSRLAIWEFLQKLRASGITILLTSHYLEEIDALADRVAIIDRGKLIAEGTPTQLKESLGGDRVTIKIKEFTELELAQKAIAVLGGLPFVRSSLINPAQGNAVSLIVNSEAGVQEKIQSTLSSHGLPLFSYAQSRPSLDDVFLAITGQTILDAELALLEQKR
ncbi:MAG: ABC transporter ATP-binding protein [Pseudanabaenaceae cyanobacterium SKYGB_i_bin29]|nr:ABC transporter ATP-binding protein [Pseudanabaenaceae cyanobacterium SKYG29]MDW8420951.1 ABC transporter ATP-binding protein [Pseudanabaenaceae cyanobacterium SKYGB_i_bin29]